MCTKIECKLAVGISLNHTVRVSGDPHHCIKIDGENILVSCAAGIMGIKLHVVNQGRIRAPVR